MYLARYLGFYVLIFLLVIGIDSVYNLDNTIYIITSPVVLWCLSTENIFLAIVYFLFLYTPDKLFLLIFMIMEDFFGKFYGILLILLYGVICGVWWLKLFSRKCFILDPIITLVVSFLIFTTIGNWYLDHVIGICIRLDFLRLWFWTNIMTTIVMVIV